MYLYAHEMIFGAKGKKAKGESIFAFRPLPFAFYLFLCIFVEK